MQNIEPSNNLLRRKFFAFAAFLGGSITLGLAIIEPSTVVEPLSIASGFGWLLLSALFPIQKIPLKKLQLLAFGVVSLQVTSTELFQFVMYEANESSYNASVMNIFWTLSLLITVSFLLLDAKTATRSSLGFISLTAITVFVGTLQLPSDVRLSHVAGIVEPLCYLLILSYLIRALALFRNEATHAKLEATIYEKLAYIDDLTNIANRRKLVDILQREIVNSQRNKNSLSIIIFDIDHFKSVNDNYGHDIGDIVLKAVAEHCVNALPDDALLGRWGGEEFLCVLPQRVLPQRVLPQTSEEHAFTVAENLRTVVENISFDHGPSVTASFGLSYLEATDSFDSLIKRADEALYVAKEKGRNRCEPNRYSELAEPVDANTQTKHQST